MAQDVKLAYVLVGHNPAGTEVVGSEGRHRYTQSSLKSALLCMGCKPRLAHKASKSFFVSLLRHLQAVQPGLPPQGFWPVSPPSSRGSALLDSFPCADGPLPLPPPPSTVPRGFKRADTVPRRLTDDFPLGSVPQTPLPLVARGMKKADSFPPRQASGAIGPGGPAMTAPRVSFPCAEPSGTLPAPPTAPSRVSVPCQAADGSRPPCSTGSVERDFFPSGDLRGCRCLPGPSHGPHVGGQRGGVVGSGGSTVVRTDARLKGGGTCPDDTEAVLDGRIPVSSGINSSIDGIPASHGAPDERMPIHQPLPPPDPPDHSSIPDFITRTPFQRDQGTFGPAAMLETREGSPTPSIPLKGRRDWSRVVEPGERTAKEGGDSGEAQKLQDAERKLQGMREGVENADPGVDRQGTETEGGERGENQKLKEARRKLEGMCVEVEDSPGGRIALVMARSDFEDLVMDHVACFTDKLLFKDDFQVACSVREQRRSVCVMLCGTSGTGKSTLAGLLAARLGITAVVSTDSIRHMMRSFMPRDKCPVLWASTYEAAACVPDPSARGPPSEEGGAASSSRDPKQRIIAGYKAQSEMVVERLEALIEGYERRRESVVCEGVHLSLDVVVSMMERHPSMIPFLVYISNEAKHCERFAVRAKYMTMEPKQNRYVAHLRNIRVIQEYLLRKAEKHAIPTVNNTNVDRSVATIHATVVACLRRLARGERLLKVAGGKRVAAPVAAEYAHCKSATWSSKDMLRVIMQRRAAAGLGALTPPDTPSTSTSSSFAHLSQLADADDGVDGRSFQESDLASSHGAGSESGSDSEAEDPGTAFEERLAGGSVGGESEGDEPDDEDLLPFSR